MSMDAEARGAHRRIARACLAAGLLLLASCVSDAPPAGLVPVGPKVTRIEELSGSYCWFGPEFNVRSFGREVERIPFLDVAALGAPTRVDVSASPEQILFTYTDTEGHLREHVFEPPRNRCVWRGYALVMEGGGGAFYHSRNGVTQYGSEGGESRIFRLSDGRLVMTESYGRKGFQHEPGIFFHDEHTVAVILDPAADGCSLDSPSRLPQPWFGKGVDLRIPECAARLEAAIATTLVAQKEPPEDAAGYARETVKTLRGGVGSGDFTVNAASGAFYRFRVGRRHGECELRLYERYRPKGWNSGTQTNTLWYMARRPLPGCVCNT